MPRTIAAARSLAGTRPLSGTRPQHTPPALVSGLSVSPSSWAFGSVDIATGPSDKVITVTASGGTQSVIGTASITGTGLSIVSDNVSGHTLAVGSSLTLTVRFDPAATGAVSGSLSIPSDAPVTPTTAAMTGTGTDGATADYAALPAASQTVITNLTAAIYGYFVGGYAIANTYTVPTGAGWTDGTDCSASLQAFLNGKSGPDATSLNRIVFPSGYSYRFTGDQAVDLRNHSIQNVVLYGYGATIDLRTSGVSNGSHAFFLQGNGRISIQGFTIQGQMGNRGTLAQYNDYSERKGGIVIRGGSSYVEVKDCTMYDIEGWPVWLSGLDGGGVICHHIWVHDNTIDGTVATAFATVAADDVLIEGNATDNVSYFWVDLEPDASTGHIRRQVIRNNTCGLFGLRSGSHQNWFVGIGPGYTGPPWSTLADIIVVDNASPTGEYGGMGGIPVAVGGVPGGSANGAAWPKSRLVFYRNTGAAATNPNGHHWFATVTDLYDTNNTMHTSDGSALVGADNSPAGTHTITPNTVA